MPDCVFLIDDCCPIPSENRTGVVDRFIIKLTGYTADELCANASHRGTRDLSDYFHFVVSPDGEIRKLVNLDKTVTSPVVGADKEKAIFIGVTSPINLGSSCDVISNTIFVDSLFRVLCCTHKELGLTDPAIIETEFNYDDLLDYQYSWMFPLLIKLRDRLVNGCLNLISCDSCSEIDAENYESASCNCSPGCSSTCGCSIVPLYCAQINKLENLQLAYDGLLSVNAGLSQQITDLRSYIDDNLAAMQSLQNTVVGLQEFYGQYSSCLRKLCVFESAYDCKVHYLIFKEQSIFPNLYVPINFDKKITDITPSDVLNFGSYRHCPSEAGTYKTVISKLTIGPAKYCEGDVITVRINGEIVFSQTIPSETLNSTVVIPDITKEWYTNGQCFEMDIRIKSKEAVTRTLVGGEIITHKIGG